MNQRRLKPRGIGYGRKQGGEVRGDKWRALIGGGDRRRASIEVGL